MTVLDTYPWSGEGQELLATPSEPGRWKRVVACLNIWNDVDELKANWDSWRPYVDYVIAVDGAYEGTPVDVPESTDLTREFLQTHEKVKLIATSSFWTDQRAKRTQYLAYGRPGDLLFIVDADEYVLNGEVLRQVPELDVGWVTYTSPVYQRPQHTPRLIRWRPGLSYRGRHHWLVTAEGDALSTHQQAAPGWDHRLVPLRFHNGRGIHRTPERRKLMVSARIDQVEEEFSVGDRVLGHEPLRILQTGPFDPGNVVYRLHTAINTCSPHESAMATGDLGPFEPPRQYEFERDRLVLRDLMATADVLHFHVMRVAGKYLGLDPAGRPLVMHHHGTEYRRDPFTWNERDQDADVRLVSNLELLQYGERLEYLPNPVPVARYLRFAKLIRSSMDEHGFIAKKLRIAHSPTKHGLKGTEMFLRVCEQLKKIVEPVLIEGQPLTKALELKATCDACFDSFWLGMQCSGLEAAAMGMPVIAGDPDCHREYMTRYGLVPYTWANDEAQLKNAIGCLATDRHFYDAEAKRVSDFVAEHHDYGSVVAQYLDILDNRFGWREGLQLGGRLPLARRAVVCK